MVRLNGTPNRSRSPFLAALMVLMVLGGVGICEHACLVLGIPAAAQPPGTGKSTGKAPERAGLPPGWKERLARTLWFSYSPSGFDPTVKPPRRAPEEEIRRDLAVFQKLAGKLGGHKVGIVLYGCRDGLENVPAIAQDMKLTVILGVWDPKNEEELRNAEAILRKDKLASAVAAVCIGNETQTFRRCTVQDILNAGKRLQQVRSVPITTTEIIQAYGNPDLVTEFDFCFPNIHALFSQIRDPVDAARWTVEQVRALQKEAPNKLLIVKECGWPSGPDPAFDEGQQARFWQGVLKDPVAREVNFCVFDASFKIGWKHEWVTVDLARLPKDPALHKGNQVDVGKYWSVYGATPERKPNRAVKEILDWVERRNQ